MIYGLRDVTTPRKIREWLNLSLVEAGEELGRLTGHTPYAKQYIARIETRKRMSDDMLYAYGVLIANRLSRLSGETIGVTLHNSPIVITAWRSCRTCGKWYKVDRVRQTKCRRCEAKRK